MINANNRRLGCLRARGRLWPALAALLAACGDSTTPSTPLMLKATPIETGLDFSLSVAAPPSDATRLMIVQRDSLILLRKNGVVQSTPFLDLGPLTDPTTHEHGVYSIAFHPQYATNRLFYVYYLDLSANTRVDEFQADPSMDTANPTPIRKILAQPMPGNAVHYGGDIAFGPDGYLYIGLGDGLHGGEPRPTPDSAQDSTSLRGKMLRIDVDHGNPYAIPPSNPFVGRAGWKEEIYLLGLRNPWRWSFDRATNDIYLGVVGENNWESVTYLPRASQSGANLGWPIVEGSHCWSPATGCDKTGLMLPILEYAHTEGCSVIGGYVYRGQAIPELRGTYFYGDFCAGWIRSFRVGPGGLAIEMREWTNFPPADNPVGFGEDATGELYIAYASGEVFRIDRGP